MVMNEGWKVVKDKGKEGNGIERRMEGGEG